MNTGPVKGGCILAGNPASTPSDNRVQLVVKLNVDDIINRWVHASRFTYASMVQIYPQLKPSHQ
jgi:hypothetical protein